MECAGPGRDGEPWNDEDEVDRINPPKAFERKVPWAHPRRDRRNDHAGQHEKYIDAGLAYRITEIEQDALLPGSVPGEPKSVGAHDSQGGKKTQDLKGPELHRHDGMRTGELQPASSPARRTIR